MGCVISVATARTALVALRIQAVELSLRCRDDLAAPLSAAADEVEAAIEAAGASRVAVRR